MPWIALTTALAVVVLGSVTAHRVQRATTAKIESSLVASHQTTVRLLRRWHHDQRAVVSAWAADPALTELIEEQLAGAPVQLDTPALLRLRATLAPVVRDQQLAGFVVIDRQGKTFASRFDSALGARVSPDLDSFLGRALAGEALVTPPVRAEIRVPELERGRGEGQTTMFALAPVRDSAGLVIAVLAFRISPEVAFSRVFELARVGKTGETYAVSAGGTLLTASRFEQQLREIGLLEGPGSSVLAVSARDPGGDLTRGHPPTPRESQPLTFAAGRVAAGHSGTDTAGYRDYRGVEVVGTWSALPELGLGVITEVDHAEAYEPVAPLLSARVLVLLLLGASATVAIVFERRAKSRAEALKHHSAALARANQALMHERLERERTEAELRLAQRLEAVGRLAAGLAHEINTPAQYAADSARFLQQGCADLQPLLEQYRALRVAVAEGTASRSLAAAVEEAEDQADLEFLLERMPGAAKNALEGLGRIADMVRSMKEFSDVDRSSKAPTDLNRAVQNVLSVTRSEHGDVADVVTHLGALPLVTCDAGQLGQALYHLVTNAVQAIKDADRGRGTLTIETALGADEVTISVTDTGVGIPDELRERVFDPFFTTREVGSGSGRGLTIAQLAAKTHGGKLELDSKVGRGTTVTLRLPVEARAPLAA